MVDYKEISIALTAIYEANILDLPLSSLGHYFVRHQAVYGGDKYQNLIVWDTYVRFYSYFEEKAIDFVNDNVAGVVFIDKKPKNKRHILRHNFYMKNPEARFWDSFLSCWFNLEKFNLLKKVSKEVINKVSNKLKRSELHKIYCTEAAIKYDSSYLFNSVFFLKHLNINKKIAPKCEKLLRQMYLSPMVNLEQLSRAEYQSFIYSLTHIIIADSKYYQRFVSGHKWIVDYFVKNIELIKRKTTTDILAEVAFCLKLCRVDKKHGKLMGELKKQLAQQINWKRLEKDKEFLRKKEHTNSLLIMLFAENKKFFRPQKLDKYKIFNLYQG